MKESVDQSNAYLVRQIRRLEANKRTSVNRGLKNHPEGSKLTATERKAVSDYAMELLHPTKGVDIMRPFPVKCAKFFQSGQISLESDANAISVVTTPDPFHFALITSENSSGMAVTDYPLNDLADLNVDDGDATPPGVVNIGYPHMTPIELSNGKWLRPIVVVARTELFTPISIQNHRFIEHSATAFEELFVADETVLTWQFTNRSIATLSIRAFIGLSVAGEIVDLTFGSASNVSPNGTITIQQLTDRDYIAQTSSTGRRLILGVEVVSATGGSFRWEQIAYKLMSAVVPIQAYAGAIVAEPLTFGQAMYYNDPGLAAKVDALFTESFLWSPVACSTIVNAVQVLKDKGGEFRSAWLPSNAYDLPPGPTAAWSTLAAYQRNYPGAITPFVKGSQATWVGARIADYEFRRPFREPFWLAFENSALPKTVIIAQRAPGEAGVVAPCRYYIDFRATFAVQTMNPTVTMTQSAVCPDFCMMFLAFVVNNQLLVGENPDHLKRLWQIAKTFAGDPRVQGIVKTGLKTALPLIMGML